ncbi:putative metallo-beta-lactamase [Fagus crenata]
MAIEMPKGLPFSVDTWSPIFKEKEASFLNPCPQRSLLWDFHPLLFPYLLYPSHQDSAPSGFHTTPRFVSLDDSLFVGIEDGQSVVVDDPDGAFTVTAFDANHCPATSVSLVKNDLIHVRQEQDDHQANMTIDLVERDIIIMPNKTRPPGLPNRIPASSMRASTKAPESLFIFWDFVLSSSTVWKF